LDVVGRRKPQLAYEYYAQSRQSTINKAGRKRFPIFVLEGLQ